MIFPKSLSLKSLTRAIYSKANEFIKKEKFLTSIDKNEVGKRYEFCLHQAELFDAAITRDSYYFHAPNRTIFEAWFIGLHAFCSQIEYVEYYKQLFLKKLGPKGRKKFEEASKIYDKATQSVVPFNIQNGFKKQLLPLLLQIDPRWIYEDRFKKVIQCAFDDLDENFLVLLGDSFSKRQRKIFHEKTKISWVKITDTLRKLINKTEIRALPPDEGKALFSGPQKICEYLQLRGHLANANYSSKDLKNKLKDLGCYDDLVNKKSFLVTLLLQEKQKNSKKIEVLKPFIAGVACNLK